MSQEAENVPLTEENYTPEMIREADVRELVRITIRSLNLKAISLEFYQRIWTYKKKVEEAKRRKSLTRLEKDIEEVFEVSFT